MTTLILITTLIEKESANRFVRRAMGPQCLSRSCGRHRTFCVSLVRDGPVSRQSFSRTGVIRDCNTLSGHIRFGRGGDADNDRPHFAI